MEAGHGPALSERERQALIGIEEALGKDAALERRLRTMRTRGLPWPHRSRGRRRSGGSGKDGGVGG